MEINNVSKYAQRLARRRSLCGGRENPLPIGLLVESKSNVGFQNRNWSWGDFKPLDRRKHGKS